MAEWEKVAEANDYIASSATWRMRIDGGWLYRYGGSMIFVEVARASGAPSGGAILPTMPHHVPRPPVPEGTARVVDADYEEIPPHAVNGSKVLALGKKACS